MRISDWSSDVCSSDLIEGGDGFRSIRIDDEERRQRTLVGKAHYRELSVVRHFGGLDGGRSLHDVVGVARAFQHANIERGLHRAAFQGFQLGQLGHRSEEHTSELQSLMRISYAVFCLKKNNYLNLKPAKYGYKHNDTGRTR